MGMSRGRLQGLAVAATLAAGLVVGLGVGLLAGPAPASAETMTEIGKREFTNYCAGCHGVDAKGGGPIADYFGVNPPSLTRLAAENGGEFPLERVFQTIDGRRVVKAHGGDGMQVWGLRYRTEVDDVMIDAPQALQEDLRSRLVRGRILEVIYYLLTIQE
jgi:mono/diheme cytochrome c family protein